MVIEDNLKTRPPLSDETNRPRKRPFSSISGAGNDGKQLRLGVKNLVKKQFGTDTHGKDKGKSIVVEDSPINIRDDSYLLSQDSFGFGEKNQERIACVNNCIESDDRDLDKLASQVEPPTISASHHNSKFLGLERCAGLKTGSGSNSAVCDWDSLKTCTCSFCSKAAHIWSDLHYQDAKGRLSAIKKSHKEASTLVKKYSGVNETVLTDQQNSTEASKLESSLMDQWKLLFVHMEGSLAQESSQLESSFEELKNLRDNCKTELELTDNSHFDNH